MSMSLRSLPLDLDYRTSQGRLVDAFYIPCLKESSAYWRAVGYFTSGSLAIAAAGLPAFIANEGTMRLVASPVLSEEDAKAIGNGYEARDDVVARALLRSFKAAIAEELENERLGFLAWLIADNRLDVRVAIRTNELGIYHEKIGIFFDEVGDKVAFTGSANETVGGFVNNFESIDVYLGWTGDQARVERKVKAFDALWRDRTEGVSVIDLPSAVRERLVEFRPKRRPSRDPLSFAPAAAAPTWKTLAEPVALDLRDYQRSAIAAWLPDGRGILEMATGTGKTFTSLAAMSRWLEGLPSSLLVVAAPFIHLVDQWIGHLEPFGARPIACVGSSANWTPKLAHELRLLRVGAIPLSVAVTTHVGLTSAALRRLVEPLGADVTVAVIADEVHHLGTRKADEALGFLHFDAALGLSATPRRWLDPAGDEVIRRHFGEVVFEYGLRDAINDGHLVPYDYHPIVVELSDDEFAEYSKLTSQIAKAMAAGADDEAVGSLLRRRAEILNGATSKLAALAGLFKPGSEDHHVLVYTSPSRLADSLLLLGRRARMRVRRFTYREDRSEREEILREFDESRLQALVAIRCLDEGVDVPSTRTAVLMASSSNPREFIQRRGRILRRYPGKDFATIHDLIAVPPMNNSAGTPAAERSLMRREIQRFIEFATLARNHHQARAVLAPIQDQFHLLDE
jgi:superfamily II DNA or RNA helicase